MGAEAVARSGAVEPEAAVGPTTGAAAAAALRRRQERALCIGRGGSRPGASAPRRRSWGVRSSTRTAGLSGRRGPLCW